MCCYKEHAFCCRCMRDKRVRAPAAICPACLHPAPCRTLWQVTPQATALTRSSRYLVDVWEHAHYPGYSECFVCRPCCYDMGLCFVGVCDHTLVTSTLHKCKTRCGLCATAEPGACEGSLLPQATRTGSESKLTSHQAPHDDKVRLLSNGRLCRASWQRAHGIPQVRWGTHQCLHRLVPELREEREPLADLSQRLLNLPA